MLTIGIKTVTIWVGILILAVLNGALREAILISSLGAPTAFVLSGLLLSAIVIGIAYVSLPWLSIRRNTHLWGVGLAWLVLTLVFEFSFGLWRGIPWSVLLEAYSFKGGNIWPVVLTVTALAPHIAFRLRRGSS